MVRTNTDEMNGGQRMADGQKHSHCTTYRRNSFEERFMGYFIRGIVMLLTFMAALPANAALKVLATTSDWSALACELGGDKINVYTATTALQDVHRVDAKPSLVARARTADLIVATGAELEIGWLPVLIRESGNSRIQPGKPGYFEAAPLVKRLEVPTRLDRSMGDIHPQGNPHIQLDPRNIAIVAKALAERLSQLDSSNASYYATRGKDFDARWQAAIQRWDAQATPLRGMKIVVMHRDQVYLCNWLGLDEVAAIEPKPGVPPTAGYLGELVSKLTATPPKAILINGYNDPKAAKWLSGRVHAPVVVLPFSVGGDAQAKDLFGLFDDTINKLLAVNR
jgi:zinc/manganese transport system substrate-binding protein